VVEALDAVLGAQGEVVHLLAAENQLHVNVVAHHLPFDGEALHGDLARHLGRGGWGQKDRQGGQQAQQQQQGFGPAHRFSPWGMVVVVIGF
jgi:hypothetical protein